jgi:acylphosphatase
VRLLISGRVQGVFFRDSTRRAAVAAGVRGWVRNLPDGRVEAVLQGDRAAVGAVIDWSRQGPPAAHVTGVESTWLDDAGQYRGFEIRG